jgi:Flp pilus assembly pilin Flp
LIRRFRKSEAGATAIEYALVCGIMGVALVSIAATGGALEVLYDEVKKLVAAVGSGGGEDPT